MFQWLKRSLKSFLKTIAPQTTLTILAVRARRHSHQLIRKWGLLHLNQKLIARFGASVQSGPFRGTILTPMTWSEHLGPFLLGTYEAELHPWLEAICGKQYTQILIVGAKFGYYAIGLARRIPNVSVIAFDIDPWACKAIQEMIAANQTASVSIVRFCSPEWLDKNLLPNSLLICDCEGYKGELFTNLTTSAINSATMLIEVHDKLAPGVSEWLQARFAHSHNLEKVASCRRSVPSELLDFLTLDEATAAVCEYREPQEWFLFTPRPT